MRSSKVAVYLVPALNGRFVLFGNDGDAAPQVTIEHIDTPANGVPSAGSCAVAVQESNDGSTFSDIAGTQNTVNPGGSITITVQSTKSRLAVRGSGNVKVLVTVEKQVNGSPQDLGGA